MEIVRLQKLILVLFYVLLFHRSFHHVHEILLSSIKLFHFLIASLRLITLDDSSHLGKFLIFSCNCRNFVVSCKVSAKELEPKDRSMYKCVFLMNLCSSLPVTNQKHNGSPYLDLIRYHYNLGLSKVMPGIKHPEDGLLIIYLLSGCIKGY